MLTTVLTGVLLTAAVVQQTDTVVPIQPGSRLEIGHLGVNDQAREFHAQHLHEELRVLQVEGSSLVTRDGMRRHLHSTARVSQAGPKAAAAGCRAEDAGSEAHLGRCRLGGEFLRAGGV